MGDHSLGFTLAVLQTPLAAVWLFFFSFFFLVQVSHSRVVDVRIKHTPAEDSGALAPHAPARHHACWHA